MSEAAVFFGIVIAVTVAICVWVVVRMPRGSVARVAVEPGVPFEVRCAPADARTHKICLDYTLTVPGRDPDLFGLACELSAEVAGHKVLNEIVGVGYRAAAVRPITMEAKTRFNQSTTRLDGSCKVSQMAVLTDLGPRGRFTEMAVRGTVTATDNVTVHALTVAITR